MGLRYHRLCGKLFLWLIPGIRRKQPLIFGSRRSIKQTLFCVGSIPVQPTKRMDSQQMTRGELWNITQKNGRHHCLPLWTFPSKGHLLSASSSSGCEWHQIRPKSCSCRNALRCWYQHSAISEAKLSYSSLLLHDLSSKSISSFAERIIFFLVRLSRTFFTILFFIYRHFCPIPPFRTLKQNRRPIFMQHILHKYGA